MVAYWLMKSEPHVYPYEYSWLQMVGHTGMGLEITKQEISCVMT